MATFPAHARRVAGVPRWVASYSFDPLPEYNPNAGELTCHVRVKVNRRRAQLWGLWRFLTFRRHIVIG